jgi:hypothetical protein
MTVYRDKFLVNKTKRRTEFQLFVGITTLHVSGSLSAHHQEFLTTHRHWYILCSFGDRLLPETSSILLLVASGHQNFIKCTNANVRLRTPDDGRKGRPKHVES